MKSFGHYLMIALTLSILVGCVPKPIRMDQMVRDSLSGIREIKVLGYLPPELGVPAGGNPMPMIIGGAIGGAIGGLLDQNDQLPRPVINDPIIQVKNGFLPSVRGVFPRASISEIANPHQDEIWKN